MYVLVHKRPPRKSSIWLSLHLLHTYIINKQTHFVTSLTKTPYISETWQRHVNSQKTQDGDIPTTWQVHYTAIQNNLILQENIYLIYWLHSSLWILKYGYPTLNIVINSRPTSHAFILCINPFSSPCLMGYGHPTSILGYTAGIMRGSTNGHIVKSPSVCAISTTGNYLQVPPT